MLTGVVGSKKMHANNLAIDFAFEIKLTGGNNRIGEIIVFTSGGSIQRKQQHRHVVHEYHEYECIVCL